MTILRQLLESLEAHFLHQPRPPVQAIHRPPGGSDEPTSPFSLVVVGADPAVCGLSYNLLETSTARARYDALELEALASSGDALSLARRVLATDAAERIIGYAACHGLSQLVLRKHPLRESEQDLLELLAPAGDHVGLVGFAPPMVKRLLSMGAERLTVLERPDRVPDPQRAGEAVVTTAPDDLTACDKVLITSTTLLNDTFDALEATTRSADFRAIYGPGAPVLPDPLFARGIDAVAGLVVTNVEAMVQRQLNGKRWGDARRKLVLLRDKT